MLDFGCGKDVLSMLFSFYRVRGLTFLLLTATAAGFGQQKPEAVRSPEVGNDGRVTFRLNAPHAQKVEVHLEGTKEPLILQRNERGIWSGTTQPLAPDYYGYSF